MIINTSQVIVDMAKEGRLVEHQKDQIIASAEQRNKRKIDVIIQMKGSDAEMDARKEMAELILKTEAHRSMVSDPRQLLPANKEDMTGKQTNYRRSKLREHEASLSAQMRQSKVLLNRSKADVVTRTKNFMKMDSVNSAKDRDGMSVIKTAESVAMKVSRDELARIVNDDDGNIAGVYENLHVPLPKVSQGASPTNIGNGGNFSNSWGIHSSGADRCLGRLR